MEKSQPVKPDSKSQTTPPDYVLEWMKKNKVPLTKENYLQINYMGQEVPPEADQDLPPELKYRQET